MSKIKVIGDILLLVITITVWFTGLFTVISQLLLSTIPIAGVLITLLFGLVWYAKVPLPPKQNVEAILGLNVEESRETTITFAHRGAGLDAPENSLTAFKMCKEQSIYGIEFDVQLTADGVPIVFHDATLERMANKDLIIEDSKWSDLATVDISVNHPFRERFAKTNIPTLEQTVTQLLANNQKMFIDLKGHDTKLVKVINDLYKKYPRLYESAIITSFFPHLIYSIRKNDPNIVGCLAQRPLALSHCGYQYPTGPEEPRFKKWYQYYLARFVDVFSYWILKHGGHHLLGVSVLLLHKDMISGDAVIFWREKNVHVVAWTVNAPIEKQCFARHFKIPYLTDTLTAEASTHNPSYYNSGTSMS